MKHKRLAGITFSKRVSSISVALLLALALVAGLRTGAAAQTVVATVAVGAHPDGVAVSTTGKVYVANTDSNSVSVISATTFSVIKTIAVGGWPTGAVVNTATNAIYVANAYDHTVSVIDGTTDTVAKTIGVGLSPNNLAVNPGLNRIYVTNWAGGNVSVIDGSTDTVVATVAVGVNPKGVGVNTATGYVYVTNRAGNTVSVIDGATNTVVGAPIAVGTNPVGVGVNTSTNKVYVVNEGSDNVSVINGTTAAVTTTVPVGRHPYGAGVNPLTNRVYVANDGSGNVTVINGFSDTVRTTFTAGSGPDGVGVDPAASRIYISNISSQDVSIVYDPATAATWYLAEGTTAWGFDCYVSIENPNDTPVNADITYMTGSGAVSGGSVNLPPKSQATVFPRDILGGADFSTRVVCREGMTIAVDRTMTWTGKGATSPEAHCSVGVTTPALDWYLPEGSSEWGFECWLLIQNPGNTDADCTVTYMTETEGPKVVHHAVPANTRQTFNMETDIGKKDSSIKVESNVPVIPERAMYRNSRREGHDSIGTTSPATDYFLAEGTTAWGFTTYVLVQNPQPIPTDVTVTYMTPSGPREQPGFTMPAGSRKTIRVNDIKPANGYPIDVSNTDLSTRVTGSNPIIAERAMYWDNGTGEACHDSIGLESAHSFFYLPDGQTSIGRETWTLVQNPNSTPVTVEISYLGAGGGTQSLTDTIPANARRTYSMIEKVPSGRASVTVQSKTQGAPVMVERAMYWDNRGAGTDTIGGHDD